MSLLEKMVMLEKLDGARGWHPNLAEIQLSGNPVIGEVISRKRDEWPRKNKNKKREEEENLQWRMNIAAVGRGVGAKEGINWDSKDEIRGDIKSRSWKKFWPEAFHDFCGVPDQRDETGSVVDWLPLYIYTHIRPLFCKKRTHPQNIDFTVKKRLSRNFPIYAN